MGLSPINNLFGLEASIDVPIFLENTTNSDIEFNIQENNLNFRLSDAEIQPPISDAISGIFDRTITTDDLEKNSYFTNVENLSNGREKLSFNDAEILLTQNSETEDGINFESEYTSMMPNSEFSNQENSFDFAWIDIQLSVPERDIYHKEFLEDAVTNHPENHSESDKFSNEERTDNKREESVVNDSEVLLNPNSQNKEITSVLLNRVGGEALQSSSKEPFLPAESVKTSDELIQITRTNFERLYDNASVEQFTPDCAKCLHQAAKISKIKNIQVPKKYLVELFFAQKSYTDQREKKRIDYSVRLLNDLIDPTTKKRQKLEINNRSYTHFN